MKTTVRLTESAVMLAAAFVLSLIPVVNMPFGGSVTLCSMLPVILIAYRHGTKWGLLVGFAGSLLQLLTGLNNLSYATTAAAAVAIILLDYVIAFTVLGLGGIFKKSGASQTVSLLSGATLVCVIRYVCHVISGCTVWAGVSIPDTQGLLYSLSYNAAYMVPETIITLAAAGAVSSMLTLTGARLRPAEKAKGNVLSLIGTLVTIVGAAATGVLVFRAMQTDEGFNVAAPNVADLIGAGIAAGIALIGAVVAVLTRKKV